jgi:urease accessory protein
MSGLLPLLHVCDSLFPIGSFSHSDGLESATASGRVASAGDLRQWISACLREALGRAEAPALRIAWESFLDSRWEEIRRIDEEMHAMRPSSTGRAASRAMGLRLLKTWQQMRPHANLALLLEGDEPALTLPVAFGIVCAASGIELRPALEGFVYTRLAATISSAMRLISIGQHEAHAVLADALALVPSVVDAVVERRAEPAQFAPALDLAAMSQQYVHSRLFRS